MIGKRFAAVVLDISILIAVLILLLTVPPAQAAATVNVDPSSSIASNGQNFTINLTISGVFDLYAWEFKLRWNATMLDVLGVVEGSFLNANGRPTFFSYNLSSTEGKMVVDCTMLGMIQGASGDGILASATFQAKVAGESTLDLYEVSLVNSGENTIPCQFLGGYVQVVQQHDMAVTQVKVSPTTVLPGAAVNINVTVQNQGSYQEIFNVSAVTNSTFVGTQQISLSSDSSATVPFTWNTTGFAKGEYVIQGFVSPVEGESDVEDNSKTAEKPVVILAAGHDVAVVDIQLFKTVVGHGYNISVTVTVRNYGEFSETFNVTTSLNTTAMETLTVGLASGGEAKLFFAYSTLSMPKGNYTPSAMATPVPEETEIADNTMAAGTVIITVQGDINGDAEVNIYDAILLSSAFTSVPHDSNWNSNADINGDNVVDVYDAILLANNYGKTP